MYSQIFPTFALSLEFDSFSKDLQCKMGFKFCTWISTFALIIPPLPAVSSSVVRRIPPLPADSTRQCLGSVESCGGGGGQNG